MKNIQFTEFYEKYMNYMKSQLFTSMYIFICSNKKK